MIKPSAPVAIAPFARGSTYFQVPAAWLGSSTIGKWDSSFITGMALMSMVFLVAVSKVRMPRSQSITLGLPSEIIYSAAINHSSMVGDMNKALNFNKEAYEYNSSDPVILDNLGYTYYKIGNIKKAEEIYRKLIGLNPNFPEAYYNYSCVLKDLGMTESALEMAKKAKNYRLSYLSNLKEEELDNYLEELQSLIATKSE